MLAKNTYLCHYGVQGMKWGIRKSTYTSGRATRNATTINNKKSNSQNTTKRIRQNRQLILSTTVRQALNAGASMATSQALTSVSTKDPTTIAVRTLGGFVLGCVVGGVTGSIQAKEQINKTKNDSYWNKIAKNNNKNYYIDERGILKKTS
jgi:hypothetical protein